jgi:hypothetical protein
MSYSAFKGKERVKDSFRSYSAFKGKERLMGLSGHIQPSKVKKGEGVT